MTSFFFSKRTETGKSLSNYSEDMTGMLKCSEIKETSYFPMFKFSKITTTFDKLCIPIIPSRDLGLRNAHGICVHLVTHREGTECYERWYRSIAFSKAKSWLQILLMKSDNSKLWLGNKLVTSLHKNDNKTQMSPARTFSPSNSQLIKASHRESWAVSLIRRLRTWCLLRKGQ